MDTVIAPTAIEMGEAALVERARRGDQAAFAVLVDVRLAATFRLALAILGNEADARDATQEIFVRAWRNLPGLSEPDRFGPWFGRIVVNTCRTATRGRQRRIVREISVAPLADDGDVIASRVRPHEDRTSEIDLVARALDRIAVADRTLLALHQFEGLSLEEIGSRLGITSRTVESRLSSARRSLERAVEVERR